MLRHRGYVEPRFAAVVTCAPSRRLQSLLIQSRRSRVAHGGRKAAVRSRPNWSIGMLVEGKAEGIRVHAPCRPPHDAEVIADDR